jgi:Cu/Zn superoxide dismutase
MTRKNIKQRAIIIHSEDDNKTVHEIIQKTT